MAADQASVPVGRTERLRLEAADPPWLREGTRIVHSALGDGRVYRIDEQDGQLWVRLRIEGSGALLAMPLDALRPHVRLGPISPGDEAPEPPR